MAFLDKLNNFAKNVGDKANDAIETTKLNSKINSEKGEIRNLLKQIGEHYYAKYSAGGCADTEISHLFAAIDAHKTTIQETEAQIKALKAEPAATSVAASIGGIVCPSCGKKNMPGTKFCSECGGKMEMSAQPKTCPSCGAPVEEGIKFCSECGARLEG